METAGVLFLLKVPVANMNTVFGSCFPGVLGIELRALCVLGRYTELHLRPILGACSIGPGYSNPQFFLLIPSIGTTRYSLECLFIDINKNI